MAKHVAVLLGGLSAEREVSISSGKAVAEALRNLGYAVTAIDVNSDIAWQLQQIKPDIAFNALHGRFGEDGCIQAVLELLAIPYTHSGVLASALAMDKPMAKKMFAMAGIQVPDGIICHKSQIISAQLREYPYVIKPLNEGSSVGVEIVFDDKDAKHSVDKWAFGEKVLVEEYISGREIQVAVLAGKALGAIEICPEGKFYDYDAKYTQGKAEHIMPAPIDEKHYVKICHLAEQAHNVLGCRGLTRADFRYDVENSPDNPFYLLEINTQPGMTPLSLAPEIAAYAGIDFIALVDKLVQEATLDNAPIVRGNTKDYEKANGTL